MVHQIKSDSSRFRAMNKELILHIIYNFCIIHSGSICHKMLLLRNIFRHNFLTVGPIFWEHHDWLFLFWTLLQISTSHYHWIFGVR